MRRGLVVVSLLWRPDVLAYTFNAFGPAEHISSKNAVQQYNSKI